jgi:hypothetical protein
MVPEEIAGGSAMTNEAFTETLQFTRCDNWNTESCPHIKNPKMQLSIINQSNWFVMNDKTVEELNKLCDGCEDFQ